MTSLSSLGRAAMLAGLCVSALAVPAAAQEVVAPPTPNADALAAQMRILGSNPRDVNALVSAGELSTKLGDPNAALVFFQRAQTVAPSDARIPAGKAGALVLLERPGEALRLFDQAERAGLGMTPYLAQRGLAYDLVGQSALAQRDYRRAQAVDPSDETLRRLALSLGISGQRDEAVKLLDPLLRRNDRAAWRAQAFVLAMGGDMPGAQRIATGMMPGGAGMTPFFAQLAALSPADRAFAVHFGEMKPTAARAADARLAPVPGIAPATAPRPVYAPATRAPYRPAPVAVASAPAVPALRTVQPQAAMPASSTAMAAFAPVPAARAPVASVPSAGQLPAVAPAASTAMAGFAPVTPYRAPIVQAPPAASPYRAPQAVVASAPVTQAPSVLPAGPSAVAPPSQTYTAPVAVAASAPPAESDPTVVAAATPTPTPTPAPVPVTQPSATAYRAAPVQPVAAPRVEAAPVRAAPVRVAAAAAPKPVAAVRAPARRSATNQAYLASVIARLDVPEEEQAETRPLTRPGRTAKAEVAVATPAKRTRAGKVAEETAEAEAKPVKGTKTAKADAAKVETAKTEAKRATKKVEPKKPDPAKTQPARWWVQVAGGARASDLVKDWSRLTKTNPALKAKGAYVTPLRATNRLLTGPFKSESEARAMVNTLAKQGTSAFTFQSNAGQKVDKLDAQ